MGYFQLADSPDRHEPGTGELNYTRVFQAIREIEYTRPVGLECSPQDGDVVRAARRIGCSGTHLINRGGPKRGQPFVFVGSCDRHAHDSWTIRFFCRDLRHGANSYLYSEIGFTNGANSCLLTGDCDADDSEERWTVDRTALPTICSPSQPSAAALHVNPSAAKARMVSWRTWGSSSMTSAR